MKKIVGIAIVLVIALFVLLMFWDPDAEEIEWVNIRLGEIVPEPQSNMMKNLTNTEEELSVDVTKISQNQYLEYERWCEKDYGFNIEVENDSYSFRAYNSDGYHLELRYIDYDNEMSITLTAPMALEEYELPDFAVKAGLPAPNSKMGKYDLQAEDRFWLYVGNTTPEDFVAYKEKCIAAGFTIDSAFGDEFYRATNSKGFFVSISYEGFNTIKIVFRDDNESNIKTSASSKATTASISTTVTTMLPKTEIVFPQAGTKLANDFESKGRTTVYYINIDGVKNIPTLTKWENATVTDGVAEYLDYLESLGFSVKITDTSQRNPYEGFTVYDTNFEVSKDGFSWTAYLSIQDEYFVEYEFDINLE